MRIYAVELGKIVLQSDKPISQEERREAIERVCVSGIGRRGDVLKLKFEPNSMG